MICEVPTYNPNGDHLNDLRVLNGTVSGSGQARRPIFRFASISSIPINATILSANFTCDLTVTTAMSGGTTTISCHSLTERDWIEAEVCWTNRTSEPQAWTTPGGTFHATNGKTSNLAVPSASGTVTWDIASTIRYILQNHPTQVDFLFKFESEAAPLDCLLRIKDAVSGTAPTLTITYSQFEDSLRSQGYRSRVQGRERR